MAKPARSRRLLIVWLLGLCVFGQGGVAAVAADRPNLVVILVDDLGRGDYSAFGTSDIKTPHIDRLFGKAWRSTTSTRAVACARRRGPRF